MTFAPGPGDHKLASEVLEALNAIERPADDVDFARPVVDGDQLFGKLFCGKVCETKPYKCIDVASEFGENMSRGAFVSREGRTFNFEIAQHPQGMLLVVEDITKHLLYETKAFSAARTDPESGLGNLLMFRERLTDVLRSLDPAKDVAAVLAISLDRFKSVGAWLDRSARETLLRLVVDRLCSVTASGDILARISDDEFAIVQADSSQPQAATALASRIVDLLGRTYLVGGHVLHISVYVGVSVVPLDGDDFEKILYNLNLALTRAKQDGPGQFRFFETTMDAQWRARRALEVDLRRALALRELSLVYQPQFNLKAKRVTGAEALLRWRHPTLGFVSPADFIPVAEDLGIITPIGDWVVQTACREAAKWPDRLNVAVNVSAVQFRSPNLCDRISSALEVSGLEPDRLELEITEGVLLGDHATVLGELHRLRRMGVRVSMDDFGTGYSSLSYLHSFPFDKIKIDKSFVRGQIEEAKSTAIIRAIAALGVSLGMTTTAEGVETDDQLARVAAAGCSDIQGYLISEPLPPECVVGFLQSRGHGATCQTVTGKASR